MFEQVSSTKGCNGFDLCAGMSVLRVGRPCQKCELIDYTESLDLSRKSGNVKIPQSAEM